MLVIRCNYVNDVNNNEQWWETVDSSADWVHEDQSELKSIWMLTKMIAFMTNIRQVHEQYNDDDDQNDIIYWVKLIRLWYAEI